MNTEEERTTNKPIPAPAPRVPARGTPTMMTNQTSESGVVMVGVPLAGTLGAGGRASRRLSAIEIAEGALLADIAVILQLLYTYLPVVGVFLRPLVVIVFTVLVLRRNTYTTWMSVSVSLFLVGVLTGPHFLLVMLFNGFGGLFFGSAMKRRMHHFPIILLAVTGYALGQYILTLSLIFVAGLPLKDITLLLHTAAVTIASFTNFFTLHVGLGGWWLHNAYPAVKPVAKLILTYWWALLFVYYWVTLWPVIISMYLAANIFVRLLGHDVRPALTSILGPGPRPPRQNKTHPSTLTEDQQTVPHDTVTQEVQV